jgi:CheY-like chemotaxis protein
VNASVRLAGSVDEALTALDEHETHVVVSDIGMPGKDGYDLLRALRQRENQSGIPVIALTAFARSEDRERALHAGFQLHLAKPVNPRDLALAVAHLAGRGEA